MSDLYRKHLINTVNDLIEAEQMLFTSALNLAWFGDLDHLRDAYDDGDKVTFDLALLKSVDDLNVKKIVRMLNPLMEVAEYLKNVNTITDEELDTEENPQ